MKGKRVLDRICVKFGRIEFRNLNQFHFIFLTQDLEAQLELIRKEVKVSCDYILNKFLQIHSHLAWKVGELFILHQIASVPSF